jgi:hypothetical protein
MIDPDSLNVEDLHNVLPRHHSRVLLPVSPRVGKHDIPDGWTPTRDSAGKAVYRCPRMANLVDGTIARCTILRTRDRILTKHDCVFDRPRSHQLSQESQLHETIQKKLKRAV